MQYKISRSQIISGDVRVPGDKSISHRAIMMAALAAGESTVEGLLTGSDVLATVAAFRSLGITIERDGTKALIKGRGLYGLRPSPGELDAGNSGTLLRLLMGVLSAQPFSTTLTGDASLSARPMDRVAAPLRQMGALISTTAGTPPITIQPVGQLTAIEYAPPVSSAQVKSALLLAGLYAAGETRIIEPAPSRNHSELMLKAFGVDVGTSAGIVRLSPPSQLIAQDITIVGDLSAAAFFIVAASIIPNSDITLRKVGLNPTRVGLIHILNAMGADIDCFNLTAEGGEAVGDIRVRYATLHGFQVPADLVPSAIDDFPVIFIAAAFARGRTTITGASELRVKESDRIAVMADAINTMGGLAQTQADGIVIDGREKLRGDCVISACNDHRIAMACSVAALRCEHPVLIDGCETVTTSFPDFANLANDVGFNIQVLT